MKRTIINRLRYKFRDFIKGPHHRTISSIVALPTELGGLGLTYDLRWVDTLPEIWNKAIRGMIFQSMDMLRIKNALSGIFVNTNDRGIAKSNYVNCSQVLENPGNLDSISFQEAELILGLQGSFREKIANARKLGWWSLQDLPKLVERPFLFRKLLEGKQKGKYYRTEPIHKRIAKAWDTLAGLQLAGDGSPLTEDEISMAIGISKNLLFVDINMMTTIAVVDRRTVDPADPWLTADFRDVSMKDALTFGEPSMAVVLSEKLRRPQNE